MRLSALGAAAATLLALVVVPVGIAHADGPCPRPAAGTMPVNTPPTTAFFNSNFYKGDLQKYAFMLGPDPLPAGPVGDFAKGYQRFGDQAKPPMTEDQFIKTFVRYNEKTPPQPVRWDYPSDDGFDLKDGKPDRHRITLTPGMKLDRFGYSEGRFLAPRGAAFNLRALPPQALNTPSGYEPDYEGNINVSNAIIPPNNYHVYCVQNAFDVDAGPIRPWFNQAGLTTQYVLNNYVAPKPDKTNNNVRWLTGNGPNGSTGLSNPYLVELAP
jgi:hypothetical protein